MTDATLEANRVPATSRSFGEVSRTGTTAGARPSLYRIALSVVVVSYLGLACLLVWWGGSYYATPLAERHLHPYHRFLRPAGPLSHGMGVAGTAMMLLVFLYSLRKRWRWLQKLGTQAQWLQMHIFFGLAGPLLVTFHTTGKLGGLVSVAFYSMWAMVVSGMIGRYLYAKIPRTVQGNNMSIKEIENRLAELVETLRASEKKEVVLGGIESFLAETRRHRGGVVRALARLLRDDLRVPVSAYRIWTVVGADGALSGGRRLTITRLVLKQQRLLNHVAVLDASQKLFSFWHVFHKPFTVLTFVIVFTHIAVALYFGYGLEW